MYMYMYMNNQVHRALLRKKEKGKKEKENYNHLNGLEKYRCIISHRDKANPSNDARCTCGMADRTE